MRGHRLQLLELAHEEILHLALMRPPDVLPVLPPLPADATSRGCLLIGVPSSNDEWRIDDEVVVVPSAQIVLLVHSHTFPLVRFPPGGGAAELPYLPRRQPAQPEPEAWDEEAGGG
jgi:hypothetical protein